MKFHASAALAIACVLLSACAIDPRKQADQIAQVAGLHGEQIEAGRFVLATYVRLADAAQAVNIYIEGDGLSWRTRYQPSDDPTPRRASGLRLAAADNSANVVYLARPCQYIPMAGNRACEVAYWTGKRFAPEVVTAMNAAVSHYVARTPGQRINLIGYSGGGAIAVLLAARRGDVVSLRTVAGNLDHDAVNRMHGVSPMPDSLNPIDYVSHIGNIPQIHFSGAKDTVVPPAIARTFSTRVGACAQVKVIDGMSHEGAWDTVWPALLALQPGC